MRDLTEVTIRGIKKTRTEKGINTDDVTINFCADRMSADQLIELAKFEQFLNNLVGTNCRFHINARDMVFAKGSIYDR